MNGLWYALSGLAAGVLAGMGMGGGTLLIPLLTLALGVGQQEAQGVNMLAFLPGAILALWVHKRAGRVSFKGCWPMLLLGVLGYCPGGFGRRLDPDRLAKKAVWVVPYGIGPVAVETGEGSLGPKLIGNRQIFKYLHFRRLRIGKINGGLS